MKRPTTYNATKDSFNALKHKDGKKFSDLDYMLMLGAYVNDCKTKNKAINYNNYDPLICDFAEQIFEEYNNNNGENAEALAGVIARSFDLNN